MASKLAKIAGTEKLKGRVSVTDRNGVTHQYENEDEACAAWDAKPLRHVNGAFFEVEDKSTSGSGRSKRSKRKRSEDDVVMEDSGS